MAAGRLSRGTPYILSTSDLERSLAAMDQRMEETIAELLGMSVTAWRKQSKEKKIKQLIDYQNQGQFAATFAQAARARTDLEETAFAVTQASQSEALSDKVAQLENKLQQLLSERKQAKK